MENKFPASSKRIYFGNIISVNETISSISKNYKWTEEMFLDCFLWTYPVNIENKSLKRGAAAKIASFGKDDHKTNGMNPKFQNLHISRNWHAQLAYYVLAYSLAGMTSLTSRHRLIIQNFVISTPWKMIKNAIKLYKSLSPLNWQKHMQKNGELLCIFAGMTLLTSNWKLCKFITSRKMMKKEVKSLASFSI